MRRGSERSLFGQADVREAFGVFVVALLEERRATQGWVTVLELANRAGISRATAYRYLELLESGGSLVIEHDDERPKRYTPSRGVRCTHMLVHRSRRPTGVPSCKK